MTEFFENSLFFLLLIVALGTVPATIIGAMLPKRFYPFRHATRLKATAYGLVVLPAIVITGVAVTVLMLPGKFGNLPNDGSPEMILGVGVGFAILLFPLIVSFLRKPADSLPKNALKKLSKSEMGMFGIAILVVFSGIATILYGDSLIRSERDAEREVRVRENIAEQEKKQQALETVQTELQQANAKKRELEKEIEDIKKRQSEQAVPDIKNMTTAQLQDYYNSRCRAKFTNCWRTGDGKWIYQTTDKKHWYSSSGRQLSPKEWPY